LARSQNPSVERRKLKLEAKVEALHHILVVSAWFQAISTRASSVQPEPPYRGALNDANGAGGTRVAFLGVRAQVRIEGKI